MSSDHLFFNFILLLVRVLEISLNLVMGFHSSACPHSGNLLQPCHDHPSPCSHFSTFLQLCQGEALPTWKVPPAASTWVQGKALLNPSNATYHQPYTVNRLSFGGFKSP